MPDTCGKQVYTERIEPGITSGQVSTYRVHGTPSQQQPSVQPVYVHDFFRSNTQTLPHPKMLFLPLSEHYLYPVSTASTINSIKEKLKKGL